MTDVTVSPAVSSPAHADDGHALGRRAQRQLRGLIAAMLAGLIVGAALGGVAAVLIHNLPFFTLSWLLIVFGGGGAGAMFLLPRARQCERTRSRRCWRWRWACGSCCESAVTACS